MGKKEKEILPETDVAQLANLGKKRGHSKRTLLGARAAVVAKMIWLLQRRPA